MEQTIPNGYILLSRKILESGIMSKPPEYLKTWIFLLEKANFADNNNLKRGHGFTSISELMDVLSYKVGYRKVIPSKKKVWGIIEWLRGSCEGNHEGNDEGTMKVTTNVPMIETTKVTHGFIYNICKYDIYQNPSNYEGNRELQDEGNNEGSTKELRKELEGNNKYKNGNNVRRKRSVYIESPLFIEFYNAYPKKAERPATNAVFESLKIDDGLFADIMYGLDKWKSSYGWTKENGQYIPKPAKWLKNRCWEDEPTEQQQKGELPSGINYPKRQNPKT